MQTRGPLASSLGACALFLVLALTSIACGGRPEPVVVRTATPAATSTPTPTVTTPEATPSLTPTATPIARPTPAPTAAPKPVRPTSGKWIDVDVTRFVVTLMDGERVVQTIGPVAVGREIDTGIYESTQTGLFHVYTKTLERTYDAPYNTYIEHWVGFDPDKANGFHSFLEDKDGKVVDAAIGRVSNGCIRTGQSLAVFNYAEVGMPVWVHA